MDYAGFGKRNAYKVDRPLTEQEEKSHFDQKKVPFGIEPNHYLSVIKFNSTYLELVDRWYKVRGFWAFMVMLFGPIAALGAIVIAWMVLNLPPDSENAWMIWLMALFCFPLVIAGLWYGVWYAARLEFFSWTHFPLRFNRKTRQVHVFQQDGSVLSVPWDNLYICVGENDGPPMGKTHDLRAHLMHDDKKTVKNSFSLGYAYAGKDDAVIKLWSFIQRYMEAPEGVSATLSDVEYCLPIDGRRESILNSIFIAFSIAFNYPFLQLLFSFAWTSIAVGRIVMMKTCKQPVWPSDIEAVNLVADHDIYQRDWRNNSSLEPFQQYWPIFCFVVGLACWILIAYWFCVSLLE
jgi:hypothetical protein